MLVTTELPLLRLAVKDPVADLMGSLAHPRLPASALLAVSPPQGSSESSVVALQGSRLHGPVGLQSDAPPTTENTLAAVLRCLHFLPAASCWEAHPAAETKAAAVQLPTTTTARVAATTATLTALPRCMRGLASPAEPSWSEAQQASDRPPAGSSTRSTFLA